MDNLFNTEHMVYRGHHRPKESKLVLAKEHAKYHTYRFAGVIMAGLGPIGLWELVIKPIMVMAHTYPEV